MESNRNNSNNNKRDGDKKRPKGSVLLVLLVAVALVFGASYIFKAIRDSQYQETTYSHFLQQIREDNLEEVELRADRIIYMTREEVKKPEAQQRACYTGLPSGGDTMELAEELEAMGVKVNKEIVEDNSLITTILMYALMIGSVFLIMNMLTRKLGGGDGMMGGFGHSKAKMYMEKETGITFKDVAGQDEAKESLQEIIDFLHNPGKYAEIGAKLPKGDRKSVV